MHYQIIEIPQCNKLNYRVLIAFLFFISILNSYTLTLKGNSISHFQEANFEFNQIETEYLKSVIPNPIVFENCSDLELIELTDINDESSDDSSFASRHFSIHNFIIEIITKNLILFSQYTFLDRVEIPLFVYLHSWKSFII
ncbi:MAG: hypothetical protein IT267_02935 [Saprospiraceae bacterium]|nr:hypothetical protein [Saprospiraceae bacterium]